MITVDDAIQLLNDAVAADKDAVQKLIDYRVPCNSKLVAHPTIQINVTLHKNSAMGKSETLLPFYYSVGLLGLMNGLFGTDDKGNGLITAQFDYSGALLGFERTK